jgi:hypothetical protein
MVQTWRLVKYKYCQSCDKAYIRSRLEKDKCIFCNEPCETVDVKRNAVYYYGYTIMIVGAGSVLIPRLTYGYVPFNYLIVGIVLAFVGAVFVMMGSTKMARTAAEEAKLAIESDDSEELEDDD